MNNEKLREMSSTPPTTPRDAQQTPEQATHVAESKWRTEFNALPEWAKQIVRGLAGCGGYGGFSPETVGFPEKYSGFHVALDPNRRAEWWDGFCGAKDLAKALTAPWPPPQAPERERRAVNIVEFVADGEDCAFDQPCCFGHRVECHAVYCHNEAWPDSPRKCHRNRADFKHEDCPGFVANPDYETGLR